MAKYIIISQTKNMPKKQRKQYPTGDPGCLYYDDYDKANTRANQLNRTRTNEVHRVVRMVKDNHA